MSKIRITEQQYKQLLASPDISDAVKERSLSNATSEEWVFLGSDFSGQ